MPRFYFNVYDSVRNLDEDRTELPNLQTARLEAVRLAGHILQDEAQRIVLCKDWLIEVTDHTGFALFEMRFEMTDGAKLPVEDVDRSPAG